MARWLSLEFVVWLAIVCWVVFRKFPLAAAELLELCTSEQSCSFFMRDSRLWPPHQIDLSDIQWREYRKALPLLALAAAAHIVVRSALGRRKTWPCLLLSGALVLYVHGGHAVLIVAACCGGYVIAKTGGSARWTPAATWLYGLSLIALKLCDFDLRLASLLGPLGSLLDALPRAYDWRQSLSLLSLRLISFNMDYYWAMKEAEKSQDDIEAQQSTPKSVDASEALLYKVRERRSRPLEDYNLPLLLAHALYAPLWLAGPTMPFNAFASHLRDRPQEALIGWRLLLYALRFVICLAMLEAALHFTPVFAIGRSRSYELFGRGWPADLLAYYAMFMLIVMWLKFLCIWRFARLWALCDGVEVLENMERCVCNNYSISSFWRGWHVSFNRWLVRYVYVPLGGRTWRYANVWLVFGFVAVWHDAELKLLAWGMLNAGFMVLEQAAATTWQSRTFASLRSRSELSRWIRAAAGACYIYVLFFVNLVGYGLGVGGTLSLTSLAFFQDLGKGLQTFIGTYVVLLAAVQIMLELRESGLCKDGSDGGRKTT